MNHELRASPSALGIAGNRWLQRLLTSEPWLSPASAHPHCLLCRAHPSWALPLQSHPQPRAGMENVLHTELWRHWRGIPAPLCPGRHFTQGTTSSLLPEDPKHILDSRPTTGSWFPHPALQIQPCQGSALAEVLLLVEGLCRVR